MWWKQISKQTNKKITNNSHHPLPPSPPPPPPPPKKKKDNKEKKKRTIETFSFPELLSFWSTRMKFDIMRTNIFDIFLKVPKNVQLVLQYCCQTSWIAMFCVLPPTFEPVKSKLQRAPPPGHTPGIWHFCRPGEGEIWLSECSWGWGIWSPCFRGREFERHPRFHVKSLAWRAIMGDAVSEDFRRKDCALVANWFRGKGLNKFCAVFEVFKF